MYEKVEAFFVFMCAVIMILMGLAYHIPGLARFMVKKEVLEDSQRMETMKKRSIPFCIIGVFAFVLAVLIFTGKF